MEAAPTSKLARGDARNRLLEVALSVIRAKGYAATSVDELCHAAGVTKGAFFHHFRHKDDLAVAAAAYWSEKTGALFAAQPYHAETDPLVRILGYIDFRLALIRGSLPEFTCLVGTMVQETFESSPAIRAACAASITGHAALIENDIAEAMQQHAVSGPWTAKSLALHTQAVLQGAFILAKATGDADAARDSIGHLRRYLTLLFRKSSDKETAS